ncbi:hypothetical protein C7I87_30200 [Mesorhizobium sp. SARCC-RB16n]|uniref:hypothetical protein n=1 Tax=Mesorhizobium sp. SARCC-RB16n TaxID=2116687 RepID=UPI00122F3CC0|nr:hypothetical protein [Mesorhizobium sp. SARCC-RB16n]KAA3446483.1 hypothetical protein C7I87_30200 [Mesorhizobium sp. SARCC-RB16n]
MPHHREHSEHGRGGSRRLPALASMIVISSSSVARFLFMALDTGDADEFTFSKAGDFARFRELCSCKHGKIAVAC